METKIYREAGCVLELNYPAVYGFRGLPVTLSVPECTLLDSVCIVVW